MQIQYKQDGKWVDVDFEVVDQQTAKTGKLILTFTLMASTTLSIIAISLISKIVYGSDWLMELDEGQVDMGGVTY